MEKKFELTDNFVINAFGIKLFQIKCTKAFKYANEGDLGGYVEKEESLSQSGDAWVSGDARVSGDAQVYGDAWICSGDDGISGGLDGITFSKWRQESVKAYGNAIVPQVAYEIFKAIELCR